MNRRKRFLAGLLSLAMCLSLLPGTARATLSPAGMVKTITYMTEDSQTLNALPGNRPITDYKYEAVTRAPWIFVFCESDANTMGITKDTLVAALQRGSESVTVTPRVVPSGKVYRYQERGSISEHYQEVFAGEIRPGTESEEMDAESGFWRDDPTNDAAMKAYLQENAETLTTNGFRPDAMEPIMKYATVAASTSETAQNVLFAYVYWQAGEEPAEPAAITKVDTGGIKLVSGIASTASIPVQTTGLAGETLTVTEVTSEAGGEKIPVSQGISVTCSGTVAQNGAASLTVTTTEELAAGTYYFKVTGKEASSVFSLTVRQSVSMNLSVMPEAAADVWEFAVDQTGNGTQKGETAKLVAGDVYNFNLYSKGDSSESYGMPANHPTEGETYSDGKMWVFDHLEVKNAEGKEDTSLTFQTGNIIHNHRFGANNRITAMFNAPNYDTSVTAVFKEAYQITLGEVTGGYSPEIYPFVFNVGKYRRAGDVVEETYAVERHMIRARQDGYRLEKIEVVTTSDPETVVYSWTPTESKETETPSFTMPEGPVRVNLTYIVDPDPQIVSVGEQRGKIISGIASNATFDVALKNIPDGPQLTVQPCSILGTPTEIQGITMSISAVQNGKATVSVESDGTAAEGTFRFQLLYNGTELKILTVSDMTSTFSGSVSSADTKAVSVGAQTGELTEGTAGTATFTGTAANIAEGTSVTVQETDAAGTPKTAGATQGLNLPDTEIKEGVFTVTATITAEVPAGNYYFKATADGETSQVVTITVGSKEGHSYQVTIQTSQNGRVTANKTSVSAGEQVTLTISPGTGYALDTISVTQTGGGSVTLSGTGNTRAFTMPAADVTVSASFKEDSGSGTKYLVQSQTYQNGYVGISAQSVAEGETVTLTATPNQGYVLASISVTKDDGGSVALSGTGNTRTFTMPASNVTVNATFAEEGETFPVKVSTVPGGTITVTPTQARQGETVTVTVTPDEGMQMVSGSLKYSEASAGGAVVTISGNTFTMPGIEVSVSCQFEKIPSGTDSQVQITSFIINGVSAAINNESRVITIVLPYGTDLSNVAPVISGANIKSISPASAQRVDLRYPRTYTVYGTDGTTVTYTVSAYTEQATPAIQLWEKLQDHIYSTENWWELAEYQKVTGYYGDYGTAQNLSSLREYMEDVTAQYGTRRASLNYYYTGGRLILEPSSYSMSGTSYKNTLDFPRRVLTNLNNLGYSVVTYNLRELQIDIYKTMETTSGFEITVSAPSSTIRTAWNKLSGSGQLFEIKASSTRSGLVLRIPVGDLEKSDLSLMKYDYTRAKFVEVDRDTWGISNGYLITNKVSAGIYGLRDR